ncbi:scavenger mRNA decapping enzyme [Phanerochaete sordida]|uniref:Scavenger mRNA decapping enzyme n=1 Tax=Phanerochaete sordida TaxID=48140 RepID=A0A9P3LAG4_9APHY|nr:scavenger mRNA decapping enzyme [Phanerochaete sordida]
MARVVLKGVDSLRLFKFERILNEDPVAHSLTLLGMLPDADEEGKTVQAIVRVEKTALPAQQATRLVTHFVKDVQLMENTDIYTWFMGWLEPSREHPDLKINVVCPATEVHIRKYTKQDLVMVRETPELYRRIVKPYVEAFPPSRTQWVDDILSGKSEAEKVLHRAPSPDYGYVLLPDMKWDLITIPALYLVAIANSSSVRSLRDLRKIHLPMLRSIRVEATRIVKEKWGLGEGCLRFYVHYQPSYYHFHVHIVNANYYGSMGGTVGQAHLLDDIISLLELDPDTYEGPSIFERLTLTYGLGNQHGLYEAMTEAQATLDG